MAAADQPFGLDELAGRRMPAIGIMNSETDAAHAEGHAGGERVVAEELLGELRQQLRGRDDQGAEQEHDGRC